MGQVRALNRREALAAAGALSAAALLPGCERAAPSVPAAFIGISMERGHLLREPKPLGAPTVTHKVQVAILGGGVAGLAAARALETRGLDDYALLELEDEAGGNARGAVVGGLPCPMGAHYLPLPGDDAHEVQDLLEAFGLRQRVAGRWVYDERHLCHSPQERLFFRGQWQDGLLPMSGVTAVTLAQYTRFAQRVDAIGRASRFALPAFRAPMTPEQATLAATTFDAWLDAEGFDDAQLRWYLDYCCRDDYGAGTAWVSAWAGFHYFDSRHGFAAPGAAPNGAAESGVLTWPEGNAWLTRRLAEPLGTRARTARTVLRVAETKGGVEIDCYDHRGARVERWQAACAVVALPAFVAARILEAPPDFVRDAAREPHAPWVVANMHLGEPLADRPGAPPSWDNVLYGTAGLGYVDARHQSLDPRPGPTVLTWYRALGGMADARASLVRREAAAWRDEAFAELTLAHPDLPAKATRFDVTRYGHAMAIPAPHRRGAHRPGVLKAGRLWFAHADWSDYSVFEEAFTRGHLAGEALWRQGLGARTPARV